MVGRVHVAKNGTISVPVYWRYRIEGRTREVALGTWRDRGGMTLKALRDDRDRLAADLRAGVDPIERRKAERLKTRADLEYAIAEERRRLQAQADAERHRMEAEQAASRRLTVRGLFLKWQHSELTPHALADGTRIGRKDGGEWVRQSFERRVFPVLGDVAAEDVTRADLLGILDDCKADGRRRTANVLLADLRQMFRFAAEREIVARNPLDGIRRASVGGKDVERDRVLAEDEIKLLWRAMPKSGMSKRSAAAVWLLLATASRVGELMSARWQHVDLDQRTWYLPETKNQRDHTIHLSAFALAQFRLLGAPREIGSDGEPVAWVFPATEQAKHVDIKTLGKQIADRQRTDGTRLRNRSRDSTALALPGGRWTGHDLRRTAATLMVGFGVSTDTVDECLNHKLQSKVARTYIRDRRLADQAHAFDLLGAKLAQICSHGADATDHVASSQAR